MKMMSTRSLLPLALLGSIATSTTAFRVAPSVHIKKHVPAATGHRTSALFMGDAEIPNNNSREKEMMDTVSKEQTFRQVSEMSESIPQGGRPKDPLIASLTRNDGPTGNVPTQQVPLFGEVPADGTLGLLVPALAIGVLGFIFSIVVAFNARDELVSEFNKIEVPEMKYTPTVVKEGECRGLCSSQEQDLDGLRNFMEGISRK